MRSKRENLVYLHHMLDAIKKIEKYVEAHSVTDFLREEWDQDATVRNLEIIGEAAHNIDKSYHAQHPKIPWRDIIDFRNIAAHDYADIDVAIVWQIITNDLIELREQIEEMLEKS